jgi:hypothetical protein
MASADYITINAAIVLVTPTGTPSHALEGMYTGDPGPTPRRFLAYALGDGILGGDTEEVVLGWQYDGNHTDTGDPKKNWRCFKVSSFTGLVGSKLKPIPFQSTVLPPGILSGQARGRQKCVLQGIKPTGPGGGPIIYREDPYHT